MDAAPLPASFGGQRMELEQRIRKWLAGGVTVEQIARHLEISRDEVRDLSREARVWAPSPEEIRAGCEAIRASWTESDWEKAATLRR